MTDDDLGDAFAEWADVSLDWARLTFPAVAESWPEYDRAATSRLWAEDWDCAEDAVYDV